MKIKSEILFKILCVIAVVILALLIFSAGVTVGFNKASFGHSWGEHYNENFGMGHTTEGDIGPIGSGLQKMGVMDYFPNAHGATGKIIKIDASSIIVQDRDNTEKSVVIESDTKIQKGRVALQATDVKVDDFVVVIGNPDEKGVIEAKFIRVLPSPEFLKQ